MNRHIYKEDQGHDVELEALYQKIEEETESDREMGVIPAMDGDGYVVIDLESKIPITSGGIVQIFKPTDVGDRLISEQEKIRPELVDDEIQALKILIPKMTRKELDAFIGIRKEENIVSNQFRLEVKSALDKIDNNMPDEDRAEVIDEIAEIAEEGYNALGDFFEENSLEELKKVFLNQDPALLAAIKNNNPLLLNGDILSFSGSFDHVEQFTPITPPFQIFQDFFTKYGTFRGIADYLTQLILEPAELNYPDIGGLGGMMLDQTDLPPLTPRVFPEDIILRIVNIDASQEKGELVMKEEFEHLKTKLLNGELSEPMVEEVFQFINFRTKENEEAGKRLNEAGILATIIGGIPTVAMDAIPFFVTGGATSTLQAGKLEAMAALMNVAARDIGGIEPTTSINYAVEVPVGAALGAGFFKLFRFIKGQKLANDGVPLKEILQITEGEANNFRKNMEKTVFSEKLTDDVFSAKVEELAGTAVQESNLVKQLKNMSDTIDLPENMRDVTPETVAAFFEITKGRPRLSTEVIKLEELTDTIKRLNELIEKTVTAEKISDVPEEILGTLIKTNKNDLSPTFMVNDSYPGNLELTHPQAPVSQFDIDILVRRPSIQIADDDILRTTMGEEIARRIKETLAGKGSKAKVTGIKETFTEFLEKKGLSIKNMTQQAPDYNKLLEEYQKL